MLAARQAAFATRLPAVLKSRRVQDLPKLTAARDRYAEELARIEQVANTDALASEKEQELLVRLERIRQGLVRQVDATSEAQERYRLLHGLLTWTSPRTSRHACGRHASRSRVGPAAAGGRGAAHRAGTCATGTPRTFAAFDVRIRGLTPRIAQLRGRARSWRARRRRIWANWRSPNCASSRNGWPPISRRRVLPSPRSMTSPPARAGGAVNRLALPIVLLLLTACATANKDERNT